MFPTRGSDWLDYPPQGLAWVKHVTRPSDLNLNESGGYAFSLTFSNFDKKVLMGPDDFLLVAAQEDNPAADTGAPGGPPRRYRFVLVSGKVTRDFDDKDVISPVRDHDIRVAYQKALQAGIVPEHKVQSGRHNQIYQMAVYCYMHYHANGHPAAVPAKAKKFVPPKAVVPFPGLARKKRRIDVGLLADEDRDDPAEETKKERPRGQAKAGRRKPRRPPPDYRL